MYWVCIWVKPSIKVSNGPFILLGGKRLRSNHLLIKPTPWDTSALKMPTWEILEYSIDALCLMKENPGHYTLKVNPLANKSLLHGHGFYYCDTLLEPYCNLIMLRQFNHPEVSISKAHLNKEAILRICDHAFTHGRFHRDFNIDNDLADHRYLQWLEELFTAQKVYGLFWRKELAGFIAYSENSLVLHALSKKFRGKSLSKYWWSLVCQELLLSDKANDITSSISASNLAALNLYSSLGFVFRKSYDVYHRIVI